MIICTVEGCENPNSAKGMCAMHYQRVVRRGTTAEPPRPTTAERFWRKVQKTPTCWNWTGYKSPLGYGRFHVDGATRMAYRYAYALENGPIPEGMVIDHKCHNPSCVRPTHLRLATQKQNMEHRAGPQRNNRSGYLGVHFNKLRQKYVASVSHHGEAVQLGYFDTAEAANEAAVAKRLELFTHNDQDRQQQQAS